MKRKSRSSASVAQRLDKSRATPSADVLSRSISTESPSAPSRGAASAGELWNVLAEGASFPDSRELPVLLLMRDGVAPLARYFGMSSRTLRRHCARAGLHLAAYKEELRRELVITLLATDLPISEVAARLGFSSSQTLARFLKKKLGSTATQVRRRTKRARNGSPC